MIRALRCAAVLLAALWTFGVGEAAAQQSTVSAVRIHTSYAPQSGDTYGVGETITIEVTFTGGAVLIPTGMRLEVEIGSTTRNFNCSSSFCGITAGSTWSFAYKVQSGDSDTDGIRVQRMTGATATRQGGGSVSLTLAGNTVDSGNYKVDGTLGVAVSNVALNTPLVGDTYGVGEVIVVTVTFTGAVDVTGTPRVRMRIGSNNRDARYATGHGTTMLTFRYTVVAADTDTNGLAITLTTGLRIGTGTTIRVSGGTRDAVRSLAGNTISDSANHKVDGSSAPSVTVSSVALSTPASGDTFRLGETIEATVTFAAAVAVTGTPQLALTIGSNTRQADYDRGTGSTELVFDYTVAAGDADTDGISIGASALTLNSGMITSSILTTVNATLSLTGNTISDSTNHKVDGAVRVTGLSLSSPASGDTFGLGERIEATVTFSNAVDVTGTPQLELTVGANARQADYNRGTGSTSLVFRYTVAATDVDTDGITIAAGALALNSGTIRLSGSSTVNAVLGLGSSAITTASTNHKVDGAIRVTNVALNSPGVGDTFERGERIEATVTFSSAVDVTGTPQLALTVGTQTRQADYNRGGGSTALVFRYTVVAADADTDGITIAATALALNSGTIRQSGGTANAALGLGSSAITTASANHKVDGSLFTAASVSGASIASRPRAGGVYGAGEAIEVWVTFTHAVTVTGTPQLAVAVGAQTRQADYGAAGSTARTLSFSYTVVAEDVDQNGISVAADALTLNSGTINDARSATTAATLGLGTHAIGDAAGHRVNGQLAVDGNGGGGGSGGPPPSQVTGVRVAPLDGGLRVTWSAATGSVSQYRVDVADASGALVRRVYAEAAVREAVVDGLANGVEYTVTVAALPAHGGAAGPPSESRTTTPQVGAGGPDGGGGEPGEVPVPALPLAGAGVLAGLLASAAYRFRFAGRRT